MAVLLGLFLRVQPNGSKLWRYKFRAGSVEGLQALGAFPEVGLADARAAHTASRHLVAKGINPVHARRVARQSRGFDDVRRAGYDAAYELAVQARAELVATVEGYVGITHIPKRFRPRA